MTQYPVAHITAQGANARISGAAPIAVSQSQFNAMPALMIAIAAITSPLRPSGIRNPAERGL
ncbi:hypothetical protein [Aurantimonas coralicida]|uniref:hypothetical protein n=1 Tax=Aurantimonas coralicida TaxID=182270 RepID=UPI001E365C60|nr:hypothetical protein [Aurantimonas coralicida]MCD1645428.1 hypothetical protein [Aurantimonas coralicida]MCW7546299.1 hypothetical protein [Aurantimonas litoralis]